MKETNNSILWFTKKFNQYHISAHAAQVAFFIIVSFFPFMMFLISMLNYTSLNQDILQTLFSHLLPGSLYQQVSHWLNEPFTATSTFISITAISTLWASSKGFNSISYGLEEIYEIKTRRNFFSRRIHSIIDTVVFSIMIVISLTILVYGNQIVQLFMHFFPHIKNMGGLLFLARSFVALVLFVFYFACLYCFVPKRHGHLRDEIPGAILASVLWISFSYLYSLYVDTRQSGFMYGSLTSIVLLMLWLYFCITFVFWGALLNQYLRHHKLHLLRSLQELPEIIQLFLKNRS